MRWGQSSIFGLRFDRHAIQARLFECRPVALRGRNLVPGEFHPLLAKYSKRFSFVDAIPVGVERMQRHFEPMRWHVETWQAQQLTSATAKLVIYRAFIRDELGAPKHLARRVLCAATRRLPTAYHVESVECPTSAFKERERIPRFKAAAKVGPYMERVLGSLIRGPIYESVGKRCFCLEMKSPVDSRRKVAAADSRDRWWT